MAGVTGNRSFARGTTRVRSGRAPAPERSPSQAARANAHSYLPKRTQKLLSLAVLLLILGVALYARLKTFDQVFTPAGVRFISSDSYLHLRRILMTAQSYPSVSSFDPYNGFPRGIEINWPPLWDFAVVTLAKLLGFGRPSEALLLTVAALFPVLIGLLLLLPLGLVARRLFRSAAVLPALLIAALFPALQHPSLLGNVDHHSGVELTHLLLVFATLALLSRPTPSEPRRAHLAARSERFDASRDLPRAFALGAAVAAALLTWMGAIFLIAFIPAFLASLWLVAGRAWRSAVQQGGIAYLLAGLVLLPFAKPDLTFASISLFHVVAISGLGAVLLVLGLLPPQRFLTRLGRVAFGIGAVAIIALLSVLAGARFWGVILAGLLKALGRYPWAQNTYEWQPLLWQGAQLSGSRAESAYGPAIYALPFAFAVLLLWHYRTRRLSAAHAFFYSWFVLSGIMAALAFIHYQLFATNAVLVLAGAVASVADLARARFSRLVVPRQYIQQALIMGLALALAMPGGWLLLRTPYQAELSPGAYATLDWLREHTPRTAGFDQVTGQPEYGVMSPWGYGDAIAGIARRPAVADGENETNLPGFVASQQFFQSADEDEALRIAQENRVRYVLVGRAFRVFGGDLWQFGPPDGLPGPVEAGPLDNIAPAVRKRLTYYRLFDSPHTADVAPLGHFRLIHAGVEEILPPPNDLLLYEIVPGARLVGMAGPGETVAAEISLAVLGRGTTKLRFTAQADAQGRFELIVPYATAAPNYDVRALGGYLLSGTSGKATVAVSESAVLRGEEIAVDLAR